MSSQIESVDAMMDELHSLLSFNKKDGSKRVEVEQSAEDAEFDRLTAQLAREAKGKASDRQKTQEERGREAAV